MTDTTPEDVPTAGQDNPGPGTADPEWTEAGERADEDETPTEAAPTETENEAETNDA